MSHQPSPNAFAHRPYLLYWLARLFATFAIQIVVVAVGWKVYDLTHDPMALGYGVAAVMSNDVVAYPDDAPDKMAALAAERGFTFPYLYDASQDVARTYDAVCTPDFFGFDRELRLVYRGRLDSCGKNPATPDLRRELFEALRQVTEGGRAPTEQRPSIGCSIKWRD